MKSKGDNSNSEQEQQNFYCSKCAIDLALKGVRVYDIEENSRLELKDTTIQKDSLHSYEGSPKNFIAPEEKNEYEQNKIPTARGREIEDFLNKLKAAKKNGNSSYFLLEKRKTDISNFYQQQILKTEEFFKRLEIILQTNKRILTDKLQKFREETEGLFTNLTKQTEFNITEIQKIEFDITENVENILKNMEEQPFKTIITKYESKITQYQQNFIELYKEPLILNKILISFKNYKEQESNYSKFNEEVWNLIRPYFSFNRVPVTFLEEYNDLELMTFPPKKEIFVSFENKDFFEDNQKAIYDEDEKKNLNFVNIAKKIKGNFCASSTESLSSPTSKKYMDLLSKINNNQENNNIFFSNYMGKNETIIGNCDEVGTKKKENTQIVDSFQKNLMFSPHFREKMDL